MTKNKEQAGLFLIFLTALISGVSIYINKLATISLDPLLLTTLKNFLVAVILLIVLIGKGEVKNLKKINPRLWLNLLLIGLIGGSLPFLLFFKGLAQTSASQAGLIHKNMFLLVAFLSPLLLAEKLEKNFFVAAFFLLIGNYFLLKSGQHLVFNHGDLLVLLATLLWSFEIIFSKKILKNLSPNIVAFGRMFFGSLLMISYLFISGGFANLKLLNLNQALWLILTVFLLLGYNLTWFNGLKSVRASLASAVLTLAAPITAFITLIAGSTISTWDVAGVIFISFGLLLIYGVGRSLGGAAKTSYERT